jgi:hypothetical protein
LEEALNLSSDRILNEWLLTQYCSGDKIEKNEMDGACSTYGGDERRIQGFGGETLTIETT